MLDKLVSEYLEIWQAEAGLSTYDEAVADVMESRISEDERFDMTTEEWTAFARSVSFAEARDKAVGLDDQADAGRGGAFADGGVPYGAIEQMRVSDLGSVVGCARGLGLVVGGEGVCASYES